MIYIKKKIYVKTTSEKPKTYSKKVETKILTSKKKQQEM